MNKIQFEMNKKIGIKRERKRIKEIKIKLH